MYDGLAKTGNSQRRFHGPSVKEFFSTAKPEMVIELGGWDGEMANLILPDNDDVVSWTNFELASVAQVCNDDRYDFFVSTDDWAWNHPGFSGDCFVSSHSIEHVSVDNVKSILSRLDEEFFSSAFIQAPIPVKGKPNWERWKNSGHIIQCNMSELDEMFTDHGWTLRMSSRRGSDQIRGWVR